MWSLLSLKVWALVKESRQITHTHTGPLMLMNHAELSALLNKTELLTAFISWVQLREVLEEYLTYPHIYYLNDRHVWWEFHTLNPHMHLHNCGHGALIAGNMFVFVLWILSWMLDSLFTAEQHKRSVLHFSTVNKVNHDSHSDRLYTE